jgi:DNA-binding NtrC family response regulator
MGHYRALFHLAEMGGDQMFPGRGLVRPLLLVLSVIHDVPTRAFVRMVLESAGHRVIDAAGVTQAEALQSNGLDPDLVLCELSSPDSKEIIHLQQLTKCGREDRICLITRIREQKLRDEASSLGLKHFLTKPVTRFDLESLVDVISVGEAQPSVRAAIRGDSRVSGITVKEVVKSARPCVADDPATAPFIEELGNNNFFLAASSRMMEIHRQVKLLADTDLNVLILGESGTGKEVIAQLIHKNSSRSQERFLKVNCAALPADLLESELFGHRHGAFTGAINDRPGKFEQANHGTLLLDEIAEINVQMQAKLLHVLQDGQFARLGAQETTKVDVRVLAATNVEIEDALLKGTLREDLFYRLSVFTIKVPPLRERREEIPYLIEQFIRRSPQDMRKGFGANLPSRLMDAAFLYDWRGNLRELRNFVTRTIVMRDTEAATRELEAKVAASAAVDPQEQPVDASAPCGGIRSIVRDVKNRTESEAIKSALEAFGWNRRRVAQHLNISYRGLLYKIQQYRLRPRPAGTPEEPFQAVRSYRNNIS